MNLEKVVKIGKQVLTTGLIFSSLLYGCKKDDSTKPDNNNPPIQNEVVLSSNIRILSEQNLQEINYFDGKEIKFNNSTNSPKLNENTFIVGGVSQQTPDGFLKKVVTVFDNGYSAQLEEAT